jgi:hypothetical protein
VRVCVRASRGRAAAAPAVDVPCTAAGVPPSSPLTHPQTPHLVRREEVVGPRVARRVHGLRAARGQGGEGRGAMWPRCTNRQALAGQLLDRCSPRRSPSLPQGRHSAPPRPPAPGPRRPDLSSSLFPCAPARGPSQTPPAGTCRPRGWPPPACCRPAGWRRWCPGRCACVVCVCVRVRVRVCVSCVCVCVFVCVVCVFVFVFVLRP